MRVLAATVLIVATSTAASAACDADVFLGKVSVLKETDPPFVVNTVYPDYKRPEAAPDPIPDEMRDLLRQTFEIAPAFFKQRLCDLSGIYVVPRVPWGYREHPKQFPPETRPDEFRRYIGLPDGIPPVYSDYETVVINTLLPWHDVSIRTEPDTPAMTVLAAIAHEDGHIKFRQTFTPEPDSEFDFNRFCGGTFFTKSWKEPVDVSPGNKVPIKGRHLDDDVQIQDLMDKRNPEAANRLTKLFSHQRWATLLAAFSPEHDFVETYKMQVLAHANPPLRALKLRFDKTATLELTTATRQQTEIARKYACFEPLFTK